MANCFLIPVVGVFVVVEVDQYRIGSFIPVYSGFKTLDLSVSRCFGEDFVGLDDYAPRSFGTFGRTTGRLEIRKLSLMSPPRSVQ